MVTASPLRRTDRSALFRPLPLLFTLYGMVVGAGNRSTGRATVDAEIIAWYRYHTRLHRH
jgi:tetrahydromethanopterin S-methyltransferase subunit E